MTESPAKAVVLSVVFAEIAAVGGMVCSLAPGVPVSVFVAFISFGIYLICRVIARFRSGIRPGAKRALQASGTRGNPTAPPLR